MIATIRRGLKSSVYKIILWSVLCAVAGVFSFVEIARQILGSGKWVAKVNGQSLSDGEFNQQVALQQERLAMMRMQYPEYMDMILAQLGDRANPRVAALDTMIRQALLNGVATGLSLNPSADYVRERLSDFRFIGQELGDVVPLSAFNPSTGALSMKAVRGHLQKSGLTVADFEHKVEQGVARHMVSELVESTAYTPQFEVKNKFSQDQLGKKFTILTLSFDKMLEQAKKEPVTDENLHSYYEQHSNSYKVSEKRSVTTYQLDPARYGITISDQAVETYYDKNKAQYLDKPTQMEVRHILFALDDPAQANEVREKAEQVRQDLIAQPTQFAQKAKELSGDKESAAHGGLISFKKGERDQTFERAAFILKADGDISPLVTTDKGIELIQRISKKQPTYKPVSSVASSIREILIKKQFEGRANLDVRNLLQSPDFTQEKLREFAQSKGATPKKHDDLVNNGFPLSKVAFKLKQGESSFTQEGGNATIVTLESIKKEYLPSFDQVKQRVKNDYYHEQARALLKNQLATIKKAVDEGASLDQYKNIGSLEQTALIKKSDSQAARGLEQKGIPTKELFQLQTVGSVFAHEYEKNPAAGLPMKLEGMSPTLIGFIVRLDDKEPFNQELYEAKKEAISKEIDRSRGSLAMGGFVASLYRNATIVKNDSLLQSSKL